ncbi:hypothetical protein QBC38DRAFT_444748 [Podospora fimiseda]|uniref:Nephrocystin 3-like N-terminal domain-containing protein n=1 Tax=Podospora fimiseda TaxID=252190 RepID=A0AAN7BMZ0_9PEZI|nr:hypothetical protein QBC38DRAFT_444748 [Podospora fimiseda]
MVRWLQPSCSQDGQALPYRTWLQSLSFAKETYVSGPESSQIAREIRRLVEDVNNTTCDVQSELPSVLSADEKAIKAYGRECSELAVKLVKLLDSIKPRDGALSQRLEKLKVTGRLSLKKSKIDELERQLCDLDAQGASSNASTVSSKELLLNNLGHRLSGLCGSLNGFVKQTRQSAQVHRFLESLCFPEITKRVSNIDEAHNHTLKPLPGSSVTIARFYFWMQGSSMERSQQGLFPSLLFQILRKHIDLIPLLCPDRDLDHASPWTVSELAAVIDRLAKHGFKDEYFCLFLDGLDEYEGGEDEIIAIISNLVQCPNIKPCISSRPWSAFQEAFGTCPQLSMKDLNKVDIEQYIRAELIENDKFATCVAADSRFECTFGQLTILSNGVWLWVVLVVRGLKRDLQLGEIYEHWQERMKHVPTTLEDFFRLQLTRLDPFYRLQTARVFLAMLFKLECMHSAISWLLTLDEYNYLAQESMNPEYWETNDVGFMFSPRISVAHASIALIRHKPPYAFVKAKRSVMLAACGSGALKATECQLYEPESIIQQFAFNLLALGGDESDCELVEEFDSAACRWMGMGKNWVNERPYLLFDTETQADLDFTDVPMKTNASGSIFRVDKEKIRLISWHIRHCILWYVEKRWPHQSRSIKIYTYSARNAIATESSDKNQHHNLTWKYLLSMY